MQKLRTLYESASFKFLPKNAVLGNGFQENLKDCELLIVRKFSAWLMAN